MSPDRRVLTALDDIVSVFGVERAAAYIRDPEQPLLRLAGESARGAAAEPLPREVAWGKGLVGEAADGAEALEAAVPDPYRLAAPMLLGDEATGVVAIVAGSRRLTPAEQDTLLARAGALARTLAPAPLDALRREVERHVAPPALPWLETILAAAGRGERDMVSDAFPAVSRRVGREPLGSRSALVRRDLDLEIPLRAWRVDDAARAALISAFAGDAEGLARDLYFAGDLRERTGALRGLAVVGHSPAALDAVMDAGRTSALELLEAAIAENPYVSRVLPTEEFRKIVLKCAFVGVALDRVVALDSRADEELSRMLLSYVSEREVAGRSVPADVWPVVARHPTPGLVAKLCGYLEHPAERHRAAAALALGRIGDGRARPFLEDRLAREADPAVRRAVARAIAR